MQKIIGRHPSCDVVLNYPAVSSRHATITVTGGTVVLEDTGSTNGTFVNGNKIKKVIVTKGDTIKFANFQVSFEVLTGSEKKVFAPEEFNVEEAVAKLEGVYNKYIADKLDIMKTNKHGNILKGLLTLIPTVGSLLSQLSVGVTDRNEKLMILEEDFKSDYCCPVCSQFLGNTPWKNLAKRTQCPQCKASWKN